MEDAFHSIQDVDMNDDAVAQSLAGEGSMVERLWEHFITLEDARNDGGLGVLRWVPAGPSRRTTIGTGAGRWRRGDLLSQRAKRVYGMCWDGALICGRRIWLSSRDKDLDCDQARQDERPDQYETGPTYVTEKRKQRGETVGSVTILTIKLNQLNEK